MKRFFLSSGLLSCLLLISSCATYHITTQSLVQQFADTRKEEKRSLILAFPIFLPGKVTGNNLREIKVLDENENVKIIPVTNHTGVRIYKKNGSKTTFYFDTLLIQDSTINGAQSHFLGGLYIHPINLNDIDKIELQR